MTQIHPPRHDWYRPIAAHLRSAYLRYSFTYGTRQEVDFLYAELGLEKGMRLLDVGCGPGRHAVEFAKRGVEVSAVDISPDFVSIARERAREAGVSLSAFEMDARQLPFEDEFDAVMSLCEGAFGLGIDDLSILRGMARGLKPGGNLAVGAMNVFYVLEHGRSAGEFDLSSMLYRETVEVVGADSSKQSFEMWNSCFTPRELEWLGNGAGLEAIGVFGVSPGEYARTSPTADHPELLLLAKKVEEEAL